MYRNDAESDEKVGVVDEGGVVGRVVGGRRSVGVRLPQDALEHVPLKGETRAPLGKCRVKGVAWRSSLATAKSNSTRGGETASSSSCLVGRRSGSKESIGAAVEQRHADQQGLNGRKLIERRAGFIDLIVARARLSPRVAANQHRATFVCLLLLLVLLMLAEVSELDVA